MTVLSKLKQTGLKVVQLKNRVGTEKNTGVDGETTRGDGEAHKRGGGEKETFKERGQKNAQHSRHQQKSGTNF